MGHGLCDRRGWPRPFVPTLVVAPFLLAGYPAHIPPFRMLLPGPWASGLRQARFVR